MSGGMPLARLSACLVVVGAVAIVMGGAWGACLVVWGLSGLYQVACE